MPNGLDHSKYGRLSDIEAGAIDDKAQGGVLNSSFVSIEVLTKSDSEARLNTANPSRASRGN